MDDFPGLLARDFGFRPQGKAAPMANSRGPANAGIGPRDATRSGGWNSTPSGGVSMYGDHDSFFGVNNQSNSQDFGGFDDIFGGPVRGTAPPPPAPASSMPVFDKPVYDDDIFDGIPGMKSTGGVKYDDVFSSLSSSGTGHASQYDDLLRGFGKSRPESKISSRKRSGDRAKEVSGFDDLIPGFGGSSPPQKRETSESNHPHSSTIPTKSTSNVPEDPFVVLESASVPVNSSSGLFNNSVEHLNNPRNPKSTKTEGLVAAGSIFDDFDAFEGLSLNSKRKDKSPLKTGQNMSPLNATEIKEEIENPLVKSFENNARKKVLHDDYQDSSPSLFDIPTGFSDSHGSVGRSGSHPKDDNVHSYETSPRVNVSPKSDDNAETGDEAWLTVDEIPLFTQPTGALPPSRPPPSWVKKTAQVSKADRGSSASVSTKRNVTGTNSAKSSGISSIDELEDFSMGKPPVDESQEAISSEEEAEPNSSAAAASAAAMKEAMDRAEAKFKHAREVRERERDAKSGRTREFARQEGDEKSMQDAQEQEYREKQERLDREQEQREMEEKERERIERERERERIERERERQRIERERERQRIERERQRQVVERATREVRERLAAEARAKSERAAVERAAAEARERAAEKAAAEAREKEAALERAAAEVRARAERVAFEKASAEARERAAAAAAAAATREKQQRNENDLESFFGMGARPSSAPRQRSATPDSFFENQFHGKGSSDAAQRTSSVSSSSIRKTSSATNIVDDLTSIFGGAPSAGEFQEVEGESEERRRARLERHQRTLERAAKALAEKNERDMQTQREQAERHRIAETLDAEIKRWAAGKEGNLRALLSTLQYVLWPECGWQPASLTDLITAASVKKVYRKATLCIHPDKVQQKGANIQQKYIAEKVFDLLKEAWNKFNSEELF